MAFNEVKRSVPEEGGLVAITTYTSDLEDLTQ
jgi:hypothetical protein